MDPHISVIDLDEFQKLLKNVKSPHLLRVLQSEYDSLRTRAVDSALQLEKGKPKETIIEEFIDKEVVTEMDLDEEATKSIKGYKAKISSLKETGIEATYETLRYILIKNKGNEEKSLEALLCGDFPEKIPKNIQKEKKIVKQKISRVVIEEEKPVDKSSNEYLIGRILVLKKEVEKRKQEVSTLNKSTTLSTFESKDSEKLYLPGEYEALQGEDTRFFTFKPERTVSNEVAFVHFRVAESEVYRLLGSKNALRVTEVKYICCPNSVKKFELARAEIAHDLKKDFKQVKPILTFAKVVSNDDFKYISENNLPFSKDGYLFSEDPNYAGDYVSNEKKLVLFLVLPGKGYKSKNVDKEGPRNGYHSIVSEDGLYCKVFSLDQILPYYIVSYGPPVQIQTQQLKLLDEQFVDMQKDAVDDKFMDETKRFYQESLLKKQKEKKMGMVDTSDLFFQQIYQKRLEKEGSIVIDDLQTPGSSGDVFDPFSPGSGNETGSSFEDTPTPK
jgi:hypothetical protein